jgi:hypothetical protein
MSSGLTPPMLSIVADMIPKSAIPSPFTVDDISYKSISFDPATRERTITLQFSRLQGDQASGDTMTGEVVIVEYLGEKRGLTSGVYKAGFTLFGQHLYIAIPYVGWVTRSRTTTYQKVDTYIRSGVNEIKKSKTWDRR